MSKTRLSKMRYQFIKAFLLIAALVILLPIFCEWHCHVTG